MNWIITPADGPGYASDASIDTDAWLVDRLGEEIELVGMPDDGFDWDNDARILECINAQAGRPYIEAARDNVYNHENDFDSVFTWTVYAPEDASDWVWSGDVFVAVCVHRGGDVRGNYGRVRIFRADSLADCGFLDWVIGWYADIETLPADCEYAKALENGEFGVGYSSNPTHHLCDRMGTERGEWRNGAFYFETDREAETYSPIAFYPSPF